MYDKNANIEVFEDTCKLLRSNEKLKAAWQASLEQSEFVGESTVMDVPRDIYQEPCPVTVTLHRTFEAAAGYRGRVCVLNFASANSPGGGVVRGSRAQEESLCRVSTLYPCLSNDRMLELFYKPHHEISSLYNDDLIYSPDIVVFKDDTGYPKLLPESRWYKTDVITCAAPNLRGLFISDKELAAIHQKRLKRILDVAVSHKVEVMVLGAFGCGAFYNDPAVVANAYREVLPLYRHAFKAIEFAVACLPSDDRNYRVFKEVLG